MQQSNNNGNISDELYEGSDVNSDPTSLRLDCAVDIENTASPEGINSSHEAGNDYF